MATNLKTEYRRVCLDMLWVLLVMQVSCSAMLDIPAIEDSSPKIILVSPHHESIEQNITEVRIEFDRPIDPDTVGEASVKIMNRSEPVSPSSLRQATKALQGDYEIGQGQNEIIWRPLESLPMGQYEVLITPTLTAPGHYPVACTLQDGACLVSRFTVLGSQKSAPEANSSSGPVPNPASKDSPDLTSGYPITAIINEIYYDDPVSDSDGNNFVEIKGTPGDDLSGCILRFVNGADGKKNDEIVFSSGTRISDSGYFVVADTKTGSKTDSRVSHFDYLANFDPQDGPDSVQLIGADGHLLDSVGYGAGLVATDGDGYPLFETLPAADAPAGKSLARLKEEDSGSNARDFGINDKPSPGSINIFAVSTPPTNSPSQDSADDDTVIKPLSLVSITEVVTDPQHDWNDTTGGNSKPFDGTPGNGVIGTTDEWIELTNQSGLVLSLSDWRIEMLDGTNETDWFGSTTATLVFGSGGTVQNFQPQERLLIGNPAGDMKNEIALKLFNDLNDLVDEVSIEDGNANSADDETVLFNEEGVVSRGKATPGF